MKTLRILRNDDGGKRAAKLLFDGHDAQCIGAHADYRREDFVFARTQSLAMRGMEWESRIKPIKPWAPNFVANLAFSIFA